MLAAWSLTATTSSRLRAQLHQYMCVSCDALCLCIGACTHWETALPTSFGASVSIWYLNEWVLQTFARAVLSFKRSDFFCTIRVCCICHGYSGSLCVLVLHSASFEVHLIRNAIARLQSHANHQWSTCAAHVWIRFFERNHRLCDHTLSRFMKLGEDVAVSQKHVATNL